MPGASGLAGCYRPTARAVHLTHSKLEFGIASEDKHASARVLGACNLCQRALVLASAHGPRGGFGILKTRVMFAASGGIRNVTCVYATFWACILCERDRWSVSAHGPRDG